MVFWQMIGGRVYDTRVYGSIRAELGQTQVRRASNQDISIINARISMGRELVDFLEETAPNVATGVVQILFSLVILYSFSGVLLASSFSAIFLMVLLYGLFDRRIFGGISLLMSNMNNKSNRSNPATPNKYRPIF